MFGVVYNLNRNRTIIFTEFKNIFAYSCLCDILTSVHVKVTKAIFLKKMCFNINKDLQVVYSKPC